MSFEAHELTVGYGRRTVLERVDFSATPGEVAIVIGPNGSGKSTLIKALSGDLDYHGAVAINGRDLHSFSDSGLAERRAVLAQETSLVFPFTVAEVIRIGMTAGGDLLADRAARERRLAEALAAVDLEGFAGRYYQELSGGERQRVQLARVLCQIWQPVVAGEPRWLILDEPISSLDIRHQIAIMELARDYASRGGGVIAVIHELNLAAMFADRVTVMAGGRIAATGSPSEVLRDDLLAEVFGCRLRVGYAPPGACFVLPHTALDSAA